MTKSSNTGRTIGLAHLIEVLQPANDVVVDDVEVTGLKTDSRLVQRGDVFVAIRGLRSDGHQFVGDAQKRGAVACVTEQPIALESALNIVVADTAKAVALLSARFYNHPTSSLRIIGVTGTNGKTSTAHLLRAICEKSAWGKTGIIGTVGHGVGGELKAGAHTTPEPMVLHGLFAEMKQQQCFGVVMEVSSHAVRQQRIWGIEFELGILTNVTRDHLDYHSSFEDYVDAKREFCHSLVDANREKDKGVLVYSRDNDQSRLIGEGFPGRAVSISMMDAADVYATQVDATLDGTRFQLHLGSSDETVDINLNLLGSFSVLNALCAAAAAWELGIDAAGIKKGLESVAGIPGRFQSVGGGDKPAVIIDYSHTPDSLERTLKFCRDLKPDHLIAVFGCGGDRDKGKRPEMGRIAQNYADIYFVTSDNPRTENPQAIIDDILEGMERDAKGIHIEIDRKAAIRRAVGMAGPSDVVAVCGKGHEDYQIIGTKRIHFDDREEALEALAMWRAH